MWRRELIAESVAHGGLNGDSLRQAGGEGDFLAGENSPVSFTRCAQESTYRDRCWAVSVAPAAIRSAGVPSNTISPPS